MDKTIGTWVCDSCKTELISFLYNSQYHIPEHCLKCETGKMVEDVSKREIPIPPGFGGGKQKEDKWLSQQSPSLQADVLLGRDPTY